MSKRHRCYSPLTIHSKMFVPAVPSAFEIEKIIRCCQYIRQAWLVTHSCARTRISGRPLVSQLHFFTLFLRDLQAKAQRGRLCGEGRSISSSVSYWPPVIYFAFLFHTHLRRVLRHSDWCLYNITGSFQYLPIVSTLCVRSK